MTTGLNIRNFKRLRRYIAEKVPPRLIYMDWWTAQRLANGQISWGSFKWNCNTAACIFGHCAIGFSKKKNLQPDEVTDFAQEFLGTGPTGALRYKLTSWPHWPDELKRQYETGTPRQKKAAVLARLDRVIERGDLL